MQAATVCIPLLTQKYIHSDIILARWDRRILEVSSLVDDPRYIFFAGITQGDFFFSNALLYEAIDTISDRQGRSVDVHIKVVSREELPAGLLAATNIDLLDDNKDGCYSIYGPHTVSVKLMEVKHSLRILAHEFGHVSYQVRNLADYMEFYKRCYRDYGLVEQHRGHLPADPSGRMALDFERRFRAVKRLIVTRSKPAG